MRRPETEKIMKKKKTPFRQWLNDQKFTVPGFCKHAASIGVPVKTEQNTVYKWGTGTVPRNKEVYEGFFPGIKFGI